MTLIQSYVFMKNLQRPVSLNTAGLKEALLKAVLSGFSSGHVVSACLLSKALSLLAFQCTVVLSFLFDHFH